MLESRKLINLGLSEAEKWLVQEGDYANNLPEVRSLF